MALTSATVLFGGVLVSGTTTTLQIHTTAGPGHIVQRTVVNKGAADLFAYLRAMEGLSEDFLAQLGPSVAGGPGIAGRDTTLRSFTPYSLSGDLGSFECRWEQDAFSLGFEWVTMVLPLRERPYVGEYTTYEPTDRLHVQRDPRGDWLMAAARRT